jgi:hypothetical protein
MYEMTVNIILNSILIYNNENNAINTLIHTIFTYPDIQFRLNFLKANNRVDKLIEEIDRI